MHQLVHVLYYVCSLNYHHNYMYDHKVGFQAVKQSLVHI